MYSYIWIEGEDNLDTFCLKRFGERPRFMENIGKIESKGTTVKVHKRYVDCAQDENDPYGSHQMFFLFMEHEGGRYTYWQLQNIMRSTYEEIRTDKTAVLRRRG